MEKALTGAAGEYYIAFRLSALGYAIGLTPRGTRAVDLLAYNPETGKSITVQTKTMRKAFVEPKSGSYWKWRISPPQQPRETLYYMFVNLKDDESKLPDVFIVPSLKLKTLINAVYPNYSGIAIYEREREKQKAYLNRWDIIKKALGSN
jgi:hypothetical protein